MKKRNRWLMIASIAVGAVVVIVAIYIMVHGIGLQDSLDFGAGAYYYADIPEFEKYVDKPAYTTSVPMWVHIVLFLAWGALMYFIWNKIDKHGNNK